MAQHCPNWTGLGTTGPLSTTTQKKSLKSSHSSGTIAPYIGPLQASIVRAPKAPMVVFEKGGSDFRTPNNTSSLGRMCESKAHMHSAGSVKFALCKYVLAHQVLFGTLFRCLSTTQIKFVVLKRI
mgnify:FL=1